MPLASLISALILAAVGYGGCGGVGRAALRAAGLLAVGLVAAFGDSVLADGFGMGFPPDVRAQRFVIGLTGQESIEHVFDVGPHIEVVADRAGDEREEGGRDIESQIRFAGSLVQAVARELKNT